MKGFSVRFVFILCGLRTRPGKTGEFFCRRCAHCCSCGIEDRGAVGVGGADEATTYCGSEQDWCKAEEDTRRHDAQGVQVATAAEEGAASPRQRKDKRRRAAGGSHCNVKMNLHSFINVHTLPPSSLNALGYILYYARQSVIVVGDRNSLRPLLRLFSSPLPRAASSRRRGSCQVHAARCGVMTM